jgi:hypothetical protein
MIPVSGAWAEEWYRANAGGMALEKALSRYAALRQPYCLSVEEKTVEELPELLAPYYREPWIAEQRTLYKDGEETRSQWIFRNPQGVSRLVAVFTQEDTGFIELYGENDLIAEEKQLSEDGEELAVSYHYRPVLPRSAADPAALELLVRADTRRKFLDEEGNEIWEDVCADHYRYTRNLSLRAIERVYLQNAPLPARLQFPRRGLDSTLDERFVSPVLAYGTQFLEDIQADTGYRVVYTTDERGRILEETRYDSEENIIGELRNQWSGDRISRVVWNTEDEERITEYEYNADGDRIRERNLHNGVLERVVSIDGDREVEELYMNGEVMLRAYWEGGRKIREERPSRTAPQGTPR